MLNLGHSDAADELRIAMRLGVWKDPDAGNAFLQHAPETLRVFRVTPRTPATKVGPAMPEMLYDRVLKFSPREPQPAQPLSPVEGKGERL